LICLTVSGDEYKLNISNTEIFSYFVS
jgi:hypothetical protein